MFREFRTSERVEATGQTNLVSPLGGQAIPVPKWPEGDEPINHTADSHGFFTRNGDLPVSIYRFDYLIGNR